MAKTASKPIRASSSAAAVLADSIDDAAFATTLAKGLVVLEAFKAGATQLGNMELSTLTGIPRPTVARLTHTLAELGYLRYDSERAKYRVGARALRMAHPLLADMQFRQGARPMMQELAQSVRGTVSIGLLDATSMIYVETARSGDVGPHVPDIGMPISVVMTAMGRAAAATLPQADAALLEERIASEDTELWLAFRETYRAGLAASAPASASTSPRSMPSPRRCFMRVRRSRPFRSIAASPHSGSSPASWRARSARALPLLPTASAP